MRLVFCLVLLGAAAQGWAQGEVQGRVQDSAQGRPEKFPLRVTQFIEQETPPLEQAVQAKDRAYFSGALARAQTLIAQVGDPADLERYPECTAAVLDFLIAGLCKMSPPGTLCEPATFFPKVAANIHTCKTQAAAT
jgi:hypothetical protein